MPECWPAEKADAPQTPLGKLTAHVLHEDWFKWTKIKQVDFLKTEILLGITICFAQVPESVAFAFMAHIRPPVALHAAWVVGLICTLLGGRSGMVNGAEGAFVRTRDSNPRPLPRTLAAPLALPLQTAKGRTFESHARRPPSSA